MSTCRQRRLEPGRGPPLSVDEEDSLQLLGRIESDVFQQLVLIGMPGEVIHRLDLTANPVHLTKDRDGCCAIHETACQGVFGGMSY